MPDLHQAPISAREARHLFADLKNEPAVIVAVSGGPDSVAMMWLLARWRKALAAGPELTVVTVDHGLRRESAREARDVKLLAASLGLTHRTVKWHEAKPARGIPAAAREARYRLLAKASRDERAACIVTAHTRDDQAETVLMRLTRGSGIGGLAAMARRTARDDLFVLRPLLDVPKSRLLATLNKAGVAFVDDPTNRNATYMRPRLRTLMPMLAAEGCDAGNLARLASRMSRANHAIELMVDGAERFLALRGGQGFDAAAFAVMPEEIRVRVLLRAVDRVGDEGPAELGKVEALVGAMGPCLAASTGRFRQTLAGAMITVARGQILIEPAPPRRNSAGKQPASSRSILNHRRKSRKSPS